MKKDNKSNTPNLDRLTYEQNGERMKAMYGNPIYCQTLRSAPTSEELALEKIKAENADGK